MITLWGPEGVMIYNDGYAVIAGKRHPEVLGRTVCEGWPEVAEFNANVMRVVLAGQTLAYKDQELVLHRSSAPETVWLNLDYSPILNEAGEPVAVIAIVVETTEKVKAERWQAGESERLRQMFQQAPGFIAMLSGPDHVFDLVNDAHLKLIGHREVVGKSVAEALPEVTEQGFIDLLDGVWRTGEPFIGRGLQALLQRTPGAAPEERFVDLIYQPVRDPAGQVVGIFVEGSDVTERIVAERDVRDREAQFRTFAEAMPNHVWTARPDGMLDWFNSRVYQYSGAQPGELNGEAWGAIVHPDDLAGAAARWSESVYTGAPYEAEFRVRRFDGTYRWHLVRAVALADAEGKIGRWLGTNTDIEDQRQTLQRLAESERRFRLSQNAAGIASLELDIASGTVIGSDFFWQLWGLSPRASEHISVLEAIVLAEDRNVRSTEETRQNGTAALKVDYRIRRPDTGEIRWLSRNIEFIHDADGRPVKMFGVVQDVTDRKEAEARQNMLTHELEHRIKNILAMVSAIAAQTLRNADLETAAATFSERLRALSNAHDILTRTRWTAAALGDVVRSAVSPLPAERIAISGPDVSLGPKMALSLALAINELGTNALKYGALSTETGRVTVSWTIQEDATMLWRWSEDGGPPVVPPKRRGFGRFLIERVLAADFHGKVGIDYLPKGVEVILTAPAPGEPAPSRLQ
ncbi:PAS domain S-box protein [Devosia sp.]|uniref:PAS domain S-box protein n=1 Tax=Devosia sp. TaxID=1871048 RepID=UPI0037BFFFD8